MEPTTIFPPPTNEPNVLTTLPGSPVRRIRRVEDTFREIRKIVVNKSNVGKKDISSTSRTNNTLNTTSKALNWNKNNKSFKDSLEYKMIVKKTNRLQKAASVLQIIFLLLCIAIIIATIVMCVKGNDIILRLVGLV